MNLAPPGTGAGLFRFGGLAAGLRKIVRFRRHRGPAKCYGMRALKALLTFALCLSVLATSVTQAIARGQMACQINRQDK